MTLELATCEARELPEGKSAPEEIHLLPLGPFKGRDGRKWTLDDPHALIARFRLRRSELPIDYDHQSEERDPNRVTSGPAPAAGWITDLVLKATGIWGKVKWTGKAANMIGDREYRFLSPVFRYHTRTGEVADLVSAGLVHKPNLYLTALAKENLTMLNDSDLSDIASALGLSADADRDTILTAINRSQEPDPAKYVPIEAVRDLMADRNTKVALARESDVEAMVDKATQAGFITPGMRDWATALCRQDPESFAEFTRSAPPAYAHLFKSPLEGNRAGRAYDEAELAICRQLDIEPGTLIEN